MAAQAHFGEAIDYKNDDVDERLQALCPNGMNVFFHNAGGPILNSAFGRLAHGAQMEGVVILGYLPGASEAVGDLIKGVGQGQITWRADIQHGFDSAPQILLRLHSGSNLDKQLLKI